MSPEVAHFELPDSTEESVELHPRRVATLDGVQSWISANSRYKPIPGGRGYCRAVCFYGTAFRQKPRPPNFTIIRVAALDVSPNAFRPGLTEKGLESRPTVFVLLTINFLSCREDFHTERHKLFLT